MYSPVVTVLHFLFIFYSELVQHQKRQHNLNELSFRKEKPKISVDSLHFAPCYASTTNPEAIEAKIKWRKTHLLIGHSVVPPEESRGDIICHHHVHSVVVMR